MTSAESGIVELTMHIDARPEIVFGFLTDARQLLRWQGLEAEVEPRPGGLYRVRINALGHTIRGRFLEVTPFSRVVYTWGWEVGDRAIPAESTTVDITLEPTGRGTALHLRHRGIPLTDDLMETHDAGWNHYIARLAAVAGGADPGPDAWASGAMGTARIEP